MDKTDKTNTHYREYTDRNGSWRDDRAILEGEETASQRRPAGYYRELTEGSEALAKPEEPSLLKRLRGLLHRPSR